MKRTLAKKELAFEERMTKQRAKRGFCDRDVWSIDYWFCNTISPMLRQLAKEHHGYQILDENGDFADKGNITHEESEVYNKRWTDAILHLAFLADEMNVETCSMKNPFKKEWSRIHSAFRKKYGDFGEKLQTEEDKNMTKKTGGHRLYGPEDDPIHGEKNRKIIDQYLAYERKISDYREECKNEFFRLFNKYFWCLWD